MPKSATRLMSHLSRAAIALAAGAMFLSLQGCASLSEERAASEVRERAATRWQALIRRDLDAAWAMHSPGWRALNPLSDWRNSIGNALVWREARVIDVRCEKQPAERCVARVAITYQLAANPTIAGVPPVQRDVEEAWVRSDGTWWHVPR